MIDANAVTSTSLQELGDPATLNGSDLYVIVERDVEVLSEDGQVSEVVNLAYFVEADMPAWNRGDALAVPGVGNFIMQQSVNFDGSMRVVSVE